MWIDKISHDSMMRLAHHSKLYLAAFIVTLVVRTKSILLCANSMPLLIFSHSLVNISVVLSGVFHSLYHHV